MSMRNFSIVTAALLVGVLAGTGCARLRSRDQQNQGVESFKNAKYGDAVDHFKQAIDLDPESPNARLYLATAYMAQWIPGAESPENMDFANKARRTFENVLEKDPNNSTALEYLANMAYNEAVTLPQEKKMAKFDESADWNKKLIAADPKNKSAFYYLGVIAYNKFNPAIMLARVNAHMRTEDPGPLKDKKAREELKAQYSGIIDDGIANLQKALDIDNEYEDAMAYMNLLIRERADLLDNKDEYQKQIDIADMWLQKVLDTKKIKAARQPTSGGIVNDTK